MNRWGTIAVVFAFAGLAPAALLAQTPPTRPIDSAVEVMCPDANIWGAGLVSNICWSCLFPIRLMGTAQLGEGDVPPNASDDAVCTCDGNGGVPEIGFVMGMWAPMALIELVRKPYCAPSLGGMTIRNSFRGWGMRDGADGGSASNQFLNYHYYSFPLYEILELLLAPECNAGGFSDFDLLFMSEIDPTWNGELSLFTQPETAVAANPVMQAACPADCAAATFDAPMDQLWWCAGCWGNLYPFEGNVPSGGSPVRVSSLLATRALASLHRRGLAWRTTGNDVVCGGDVFPMIPKQQYRMSMMFPVPEADSASRTPRPSTSGSTGVPAIDNYQWNQKCCHNIGAPTTLWGEWRSIPASGEDYVYLLWRWTDCCVR